MLKKEINNIELSVDKPYEIKLVNLLPGSYRIRIIHQCREVFKKPRSLFLTFDIPQRAPQEIKDLLGLQNISEQNGVFAYIGGGEEKAGFYVQEIDFFICGKINKLYINVKSFLSMAVTIDSLNMLLMQKSIGGDLISLSEEYSVDFNVVASLVSNSFILSPNDNRGFILKNIRSGVDYSIRLFYKDKKLFDIRKAALMSFGSTEPVDLHLALGLSKSSEQYGVFEYIGGGRQISNSCYMQDIVLHARKNINELQVKLHLLATNVQLNVIGVHFLNNSYLKYIPYQLENGVREVGETKFSNIDFSLSFIESVVEEKELEDVDILIYGDISPNVIDGSSIWLTSIINLLSIKHNVLVIFKDNINKEKNILSNIIASGWKGIEPRELGINQPLNNVLAVEVLKKLDKVIPSIRGVVTRGFELAKTIQQDDTFINRRCVYLTDFYQVNEKGFFIPEDKAKYLSSVVLNSDYLLVQTKRIKERLKEITNIDFRSVLLPPSLPDNLDSLVSTSLINKEIDTVYIGYAGKVQPNWGVEELITWCRELISQGINIQLHIATGKIYSSDRKDGFVNRINDLLSLPFIEVHTDLDRFGAMSLMKAMDYVWCYRSPVLEDSTLEVSTKLIEMAVLQKPALCYPSEINKNLLSNNYPFYVKCKEDFLTILKNKSLPKDFDYGLLAQRIKYKHSFEKISNDIESEIFVDSFDSLKKDKKILVAGHDLKFINPWISYLKKAGYQVKVDIWEWGKATDLNRSKKLLDWADIIFCEWGLANAVWYSQNNLSKKPLYIRAHAQEVRERARKFGSSLDINNVTKVIFVADHIKEKALTLWNWPKEKCLVIPNYLLSDKFFLRKAPLTYNLGMVGIIPQTKRFDRAIDLLERLIEDGKDAHLYIKGHRPENLPFMQAPGRKKELDYYNQLYEHIAQSPKLKDRVHFDGWGNDVALWYQKIDFILSPSDAESFHYALADGVLSGCIPIVWSWENADVIYPKEWVVYDQDQAVTLINEYEMFNNQALKKHRNCCRQKLLNMYSDDIVFDKLDGLLGI
ncbi:hypothetical protein B9T19_02730 [Ignatzschineria sp. F8392]|uniref:glycosyltransferase n=1 Tax=Ignatzschineria sp. F8392 TaxID=1980117 RepID=UPI000B988D25|nr:glycosyltransferase [Ignatzschineria sp. F8392]OYQ81600.1 hypothetical protein B9T19_02730 [Ignatzschineria sp. F8392]